MDAAGIESLERATVEAVAPPEVLEIGGWIVPFDGGTIGRAKSAAPLRHDLDASAVDEIVAAYRARGLSPAFRSPTFPPSTTCARPWRATAFPASSRR